MTPILIFALGACLLGWHRAHERYRHLHRNYRSVAQQNNRVIKLNDHLKAELARACEAISPRPPRLGPNPEHWSDTALKRLATDVGLRLVDEPSREAHSHATKGPA